METKEAGLMMTKHHLQGNVLLFPPNRVCPKFRLGGWLISEPLSSAGQVSCESHLSQDTWLHI